MSEGANMKSKTCLMMDGCGLHTEQALRLLRDCSKVYYCLLEEGESELFGKIAEGLDGLERISSPWEIIDSVDFIVCPDSGSAEVVEFLRKHDYPVAGAGSAERVETDRWYERNLQKWGTGSEVEWAKNEEKYKGQGQNLPTQKTIKVTGVSDLKDFCRTNKDYYIKVDNEYRNISESFKHIDFKASEPRIDYIAFKAGPFKEDVVFICEELLEGIEPGMDGITFDGDLLFPTMAGYEKCKKGYVCRVYGTAQEYPKPFEIINAGLSPEFKKRKTRFFYSTEMKISKDRIPYLIDSTLRFASPGVCAVQVELIYNYTEVLYGLATGQKISPKMLHKYGAAIPFSSPEASKSFINISFPKEMRQWVKLSLACKKGQDYYSIPPCEPIGCAVAVGDSVKEVMGKCLERIKEVKGEGIAYDESGFEKIPEDINTGKILGISF